MEDNRLLKPTDIPLIITSRTSSPDQSLKNPENGKNGKNRGSDKKKTRNTGSGSLKYDIGARNNSITNLKIPTKWSSVKIKGTGFIDSRKSIVKIESCNGMPNLALNASKEYLGLKSPTPGAIKNLGEVKFNDVSKMYEIWSQILEEK